MHGPFPYELITWASIYVQRRWDRFSDKSCNLKKRKYMQFMTERSKILFAYHSWCLLPVWQDIFWQAVESWLLRGHNNFLVSALVCLVDTKQTRGSTRMLSARRQREINLVGTGYFSHQQAAMPILPPLRCTLALVTFYGLHKLSHFTIA